MSHQPQNETTGFEVLSSKISYKDPQGQVDIREDQVSFPDGSTGTRVVAQRPAAVACVCINDKNEVALVDQWRAPLGKHLLELPAGKLDIEGEDPLDGMRRELAEEARLQANTFEELTSIYVSSGWTDEKIAIYKATNLHEVDLPEGFSLEAEEADMKLVWIPLQEAQAMARDGRIFDAKSVIGLLLV